MNENALKEASKWLDALKVAIAYEKNNAYGSTSQQYLAVMSKTLNTPLQTCSNCGGVMRKAHNDFLTRIWKELLKIDEFLVPPVPAFKSGKYTSKFWADNFRICSFDILNAEKRNAMAESKRFSTMKNTLMAESYKNDEMEIFSYYQTKMSYFENYLPSIQPMFNSLNGTNEKLDYNFAKVYELLQSGAKRNDICDIYNITIKELNADIEKFEKQQEEMLKDFIQKAGEPKTEREKVTFEYMKCLSMDDVAKKFNITVQDVEYCIKDVLSGYNDGDITYPRYEKELVEQHIKPVKTRKKRNNQ